MFRPYLQDGSIVVTRDAVFIRDHPTTTEQWSGNRDLVARDHHVRIWVEDGFAEVLRAGWGKKLRPMPQPPVPHQHSGPVQVRRVADGFEAIG